MLPEDITLPTNRKFGLFFAFVFLLIAAYFVWVHGIGLVGVIAAVIAITFLLTALFMPSILSPLNKLWAYIGLLLGMIVSPIVLGLIFFGLFTPVAAVMKLKGRDELRLKNKAQDSHWINRDPHGPTPDSFKDQF